MNNEDFQGLEKGRASFSKVWNKQRFSFPSLGIVALVAGLLVVLGGACVAFPAVKERQAAGGSVTLQGDLPLVRLTGDGAQMGRQQAELLGAQARKLLTLVERSPQFHPSTADVARLEKQLAPEHIAEMVALAKATGLPRAAAISANVALDTLCTVLVTGADGRGPVRVARNMDFFPAGVLGPATVVMVRKPAGRHAFAAVTWPGYAGVITGMNDAGVTAAILQNKMEERLFTDGTPIAFRAREILEEAADVEQAAETFARSPVASSHFLLLADTRSACIVWRDAVGKLHRRDAQNGWLAWSNGTPDERDMQHEARAVRLAAAIAGAPADVSDAWLKENIVAVRLRKINAQVMLFKPGELSLELARAKLWRSAGTQPWSRIELAGWLR